MIQVKIPSEEILHDAMMLGGLRLLWTSVLSEQVLSLLLVCDDTLASPPLEYSRVEMGVLILITKPCD